MKYLLNTSTLPVLSVAQYGTMLDAYEVLSNQMDDVAYSSDTYWNNFDNDKYQNFLVGIIQDNFDGNYILDGIKVNLKFGDKIIQPKYYNFANDTIDVDVTANKSDLLRYANEHAENFEIFLKDNYSSHDGFISFGANNYKDWLKAFKDNETVEAGAILHYLFINECDTDFRQEAIFEYLKQDCYYTDFLTDEFNEFLESLEQRGIDVACASYNQKPDLNEAFDDWFTSDLMEYEEAKEIFVHSFDVALTNIENKTAKLF